MTPEKAWREKTGNCTFGPSRDDGGITGGQAGMCGRRYWEWCGNGGRGTLSLGM